MMMMTIIIIIIITIIITNNCPKITKGQLGRQARAWATGSPRAQPRRRAVKKILSSKLLMNSRRLWNSQQRHKFLRAKASRDILKFKVSEMAFSGVFKRYFPPRTPCCLVYTQDWEQCRRNFPGVPRRCTVRTFHRSKRRYPFNVIQNWETDALQIDVNVWLLI